MRIVLSVFAGILFSVFLVVTASFIISFIYEDEVSELFLKELNNRIEEDIKAGEVNLSLLKKFPNAVVELQSFELYSSSEKKGQEEGSLSFSAEKIYFQFDVVNLFTGTYNLEKIYVNHSQLNLISGKRKPLLNVDQHKSSTIHINIKDVVFNDLYFSVLNEDRNFSLEGNASEVLLNGNISSNEFSLNIDSRLFIDDMIIDDFPYVHRKNMRLVLSLHVNPNRYAIRSGKIYYENIPFSAEGTYNRNSRKLNLNLEGNQLNVNDFKLYLPWKIKKQLKAVTIRQGKLDFYAWVKGPLKDGKPEFQADFNLSKGDLLVNQKKEVHLENISFSGYISNGRYNAPGSSILSMSDLHAEYGNSELNCNLELSDFQNPQLVSDGSLSLDLEKLPPGITGDKLKELAGSVYMNYEFEEQLKNIDDLGQLIQYGKLTCDARIKDVAFAEKGYQVEVENGFAYLDRNLYLDSLQVVLNGNPMEVDGQIYDVYRNLTDSVSSYLFKVSVESPEINLNQIFAPNRSTNDTARHFRFPEKMDGEINLQTDRFQWGDFYATDMSGNLSFNSSRMQMKRLEFNALEGKTYARFDLKHPPDNKKDLMLDSRMVLKHINIHELFTTFNNFGQEYIVARNLRGFLNGEVKFMAELNDQLKINKKSIYNYSDIKIDNGKLIEFEPLIKTANFISLEELKQVNFSQLSNEITIENQRIHIPEMDINSSAFDLTVSGYHTFGNEFSYDLSLLLSQVLSKKARQNDDLNSEFGNIREDGVGRTKLFLKIHGKPDKYAIQYDKQGVKDRIRQDLKKEKQELKSIFQEEFGWFKKDTTLQAEKEKPDSNRFNVRWEDQENRNTQTKDKMKKEPGKEKKDEPFTIEWESDTLK